MNLTEQQIQELRDYLVAVELGAAEGELSKKEAQYLLNTLDENKALKEGLNRIENKIDRLKEELINAKTDKK